MTSLYRFLGSANGGVASFGRTGKVLLSTDQWMLAAVEGFLSLTFGLLPTPYSAARAESKECSNKDAKKNHCSFPSL